MMKNLLQIIICVLFFGMSFQKSKAQGIPIVYADCYTGLGDATSLLGWISDPWEWVVINPNQFNNDYTNPTGIMSDIHNLPIGNYYLMRHNTSTGEYTNYNTSHLIFYVEYPYNSPVAISTTNINIGCYQTADLNSVVTSTAPANTTIVWRDSNNNIVSNPAAVSTGEYKATYTKGNCESWYPVTVTITDVCCYAGPTAPALH